MILLDALVGLVRMLQRIVLGFGAAAVLCAVILVGLLWTRRTGRTR